MPQATRRPAAKRRTRKKSSARRSAATLPVEPLWYKNAIIYELHVRAFFDSDGDGIGDFAGLTRKLDYLQDLGVTALWLLPFYPSPLRDDGYDIADYTGVHASYGSIADMRRFIREAHKRGLRVITECVINHTSDQHAWFQRARNSPPGSKWRDFYVWSDTPDRYQGTRIIFKDFETSNWTRDPVAGQYYWHRFYSHQPDLNFDNPAVHDAVLKVVDHWFGMGVDGMRLDAVPYLYEREGTNCENLPETHEFLKKLRAHVDEHHPGRMLLAEANQWPEDAAEYFGDGDECHMNFHFPIMPRLFMSVRMEDRFPLVDILDQTPQIPDNCQWAIFLRNHDELTLEMVTDEERDYMYRVYADERQARINLGIRRRLAPLLENSRRKIELLNAMLFSLPGTPVLYYGDEIGMGDNFYLGDRNGVRTPMQWSSDRNAGFSSTNPQKLYLPVIVDPEYHYEAVNVEAQQQNPSSLLWWMKRLIALRKRHPVLGNGSIRFLTPDNAKVLAFLREDGEETILIVANLSRFTQAAEINLSEFRGRVPVELFGYTQFPAIGELPYFLTLGPHGFYWFALRPDPTVTPDGQAAGPTHPTLEISDEPGRWLTSKRALGRLARVLADDLPRRRWFRAKSRTVRDVTVTDAITIPHDAGSSTLAVAMFLVQVEYASGEPETYAVPLALGSPAHTSYVFGHDSPAVVAEVHKRGEDQPWLLYDAMVDGAVGRGLLDVMVKRRRCRGSAGVLVGSVTATGRKLGRGAGELDVYPSRAEQSNSAATFGDQLLMKLFRRVEPGINPEIEVGDHLTQRVEFPHTPPLAGTMMYERDGDEDAAVLILQQYVPHESVAWTHALDELARYYERALAHPDAQPEGLSAVQGVSALNLAAEPMPDYAWEMIGEFLHSAHLIGQRTAEMHAALADARGDPAFEPEPFGQLNQRSLYQSLRNSVRRSVQTLRSSAKRLPEHVQPLAEAVLRREKEIHARLGDVTARRLSGRRIRCHGDYHLGQVLWTGRDFVIIDFEGEPARPLGERRLKWTPLRDVAGMLRSFEYAAHAALRVQVERGTMEHDATRDGAERWAQYWQMWVSGSCLRSYLATLPDLDDRLLPDDAGSIGVLLNAWLIEKAMYEVRYELDNRPDWVDIPLRGVEQLLNMTSAANT